MRLPLAALVACLLTGSTSAQDITSNLVAHWKLDDLSGTTALDSTSNNYNGTLVGDPTWRSASVIDGGLDFETTDGVDRIDAGTFDVTGSGLTIAAWIRQEDPLNDGRIVIKSNSNVSTGQSWGLTVDETGELDFRVTAGGTWDRLRAAGVISPNTWHHVAGTYDGTTMRLYLDGQLIASKTHSVGGAIAGDSSHTVTLGDSVIGGRPFDGWIDDVRLYDRTLTSTDLLTLYNSVLKGHWKLDETSGTTAADSSGFSRDGTYIGSPALGASGVFDYATTLNTSSTGDNIDLPSAALDGLSDVTVSFWIKTTKTGVQSVLSGAGPTSTNEFIVYFSSDTSLSIYIHDTPIAWAVDSIADGQWHHFAVVIEDVANGVTIYQDGVSLGTKTHGPGGTPLQVSAGGLIVGQEQDSVGGGFQASQEVVGDLDDLRIYGQALTEQEIAELYGLLGHWTFDEGSGVKIADSSLAANDANFNTGAPIWVTGMRGGALEFDGTSDAITGTEFAPPEKGTVAFWMRSDGPPPARQRIWGLGGDFEMWQDPDGLVSMDVSTDGFQGGFITTAPLYSPGRWYHIAAVYDSDDDSYEIYIDGQLHKSGTSTWAMTKQAAAQLSFSTRTGNTERFAGALDDFRIYNRKLSAAEVALLYGLVGHWRLDETSGTVAVDSSGIGNDAMHTGGVAVNAIGPYPGTGDVAAEFDGLDDESATGSDFDPPATGAVAFWMRGAATPPVRQRLLGVNGNWEVRQEIDGTIKFDLGASPYVGSESFATTDALDVDGRWYHVVANFNDTDDTYKVYVNGQLQASGVSPVNLVSQSAGILSIGTRTGSSENWKGAMFDLRIYNRELTHRQVAELYGLVGWWKLDETSGSVAVDSSGTDLHGTYVSSPSLSESSKTPALGTSVSFDGIADYVDLPDMQFDFSNGIAITAWMKPTAAPSPWFAMFGMANGADVDEIWFGWSLGFGALASFSDTTDGSPLRSLYDSDEPAVGVWQHCIISIDNAGNATIYRDGAAIASGFTSLPTNFIRTNNFIAKSVQNDEFPGRLDDVRLYHRPISSDEARQLFDAGTAGLRIIQWVEAR